MRQPTIVVSGFGPWAAARENPTLAVLAHLRASDTLAGQLTTLELPVDSTAVCALLAETLDRLRPDLWIGLGLALGAAVIAVERVAVNLLDFSGPDVGGLRHDETPVVPDGPAAYFATVPVKRIVRDLRQVGVPARVSNSASTFLCNQMMYTLLHLIDRKGMPTRAGFLHVPAHPGLAASLDPGREVPSMSIDVMAAAVQVAVATALEQAPGNLDRNPLSQS